MHLLLHGVARFEELTAYTGRHRKCKTATVKPETVVYHFLQLISTAGCRC